MAHGTGNYLVTIERLAQSEGCRRARVWPRPLDDRFDQWGLEGWYLERGYEGADGTEDMEKRIAREPPGKVEGRVTYSYYPQEWRMSALPLQADICGVQIKVR